MTPLEERLVSLIQSHCDASVSEIVSGLEIRWDCDQIIDDLREAHRDRDYLDVRNLELERENETLVTRLEILTGTVDVSPEEQLRIVREWLAGGGQ